MSSYDRELELLLRRFAEHILRPQIPSVSARLRDEGKRGTHFGARLRAEETAWSACPRRKAPRVPLDTYPRDTR